MFDSTGSSKAERREVDLVGKLGLKGEQLALLLLDLLPTIIMFSIRPSSLDGADQSEIAPCGQGYLSVNFWRKRSVTPTRAGLDVSELRLEGAQLAILLLDLFIFTRDLIPASIHDR